MEVHTSTVTHTHTCYKDSVEYNEQHTHTYSIYNLLCNEMSPTSTFISQDLIYSTTIFSIDESCVLSTLMKLFFECPQFLKISVEAQPYQSTVQYTHIMLIPSP